MRDVYTEPVDAWVTHHPIAPSSELLAKGLRAVDNVLADTSALRKLWAASEDLEAWQASVLELRQRVEPRTSGGRPSHGRRNG